MKSSKEAKCLSVSPGKSNDKRCADREPGNSRPKASDQIFNVLPRGLPAHSRKHVIVNVLEGHIHISCDFRVAGDCGDQLIAPMGGMRIQQPDPKFTLDRRKLIEQANERRPEPGIHGLAWTGFFRPQIHPEIGRVLTDEVDLPHSFSDKIANFRNHGFDRAAPVASAHLRNDAKAARMVAAFGDLYVCGMGRGQPETWRIIVGDVSRPGRNQQGGTVPSRVSTSRKIWPAVAT